MKSRAKFLIITLLLICLYSCKQTIEGVTSKWESTKFQVESIQSKYPNLSSFLSEDLQKAEVMYFEAQKLNDEKEKIKAINDAITVLRSDLLRTFENLEENIENFDENIDYINSEFTDEEVTRELDRTIIKAELEEEELVSKISDDFDTYDAAVLALNDLNRKFSDYNSIFRRHIDEKEDLDRQKVDEDKTSVNIEDKHDHNESDAMIKCKYCGTKNDKKASKCQSCGASISNI